MARVISWCIDTNNGKKYAYISGSTLYPDLIQDSQRSDVEELGKKVTRDWDEPTYKAQFENYLIPAIVERFGGRANIKYDYKYYFDATEGEGVYIITGKDGSDVTDYGTGFYRLVVSNGNVALGLGGDYVLDVASTVYTYIYIEDKTGERHDVSQVRYRPADSDNWVVASPSRDGDKFKVPINLPAGTDFSSYPHTREYEIEVSMGSWVETAIFTVSGVKDGVEGVSYDLLIAPKTMKYTDEVKTVSCKVVRNGEVIARSADLEPDGISIWYKYGSVVNDFESLERNGEQYVYPRDNGKITYDKISNVGHSDKVGFYLVSNENIIDYDECAIIFDGVDGGNVSLELDNELDGISVGSDSILDLPAGRTVKTGTKFTLYSGATPLTITRIETESSDDSGTATDGVVVSTSIIESGKRGKLDVTFSNGFDFGAGDYRFEVTIYVTGGTGANETYAESKYVVIGIPGGKDGDVYSIVPNVDYITYDPNKEPMYSGEERLTASPTIGFTELTEQNKSDFGIENFEVRYSIDASYNSAASRGSTIQYPAGGIVISSLFEMDPIPQFVAFYLFVRISGTWIMADRESVPFISHGINGNSVWVELGNELDAVSVGDDTDLDLDAPIEVGTSVVIMSGNTQVPIRNVEVIPYDTEDSTQYGTTSSAKAQWSINTNYKPNEGKVTIKLKDGFEFGTDFREQLYIAVTADTPDRWTGFAQYVIKGIKGGKDGYVYRIVPEVDYVRYRTNSSTKFDETHVKCDAYYGTLKLGEAGFTNGRIYYSINRLYSSMSDTSAGQNEKAPRLLSTSGVEMAGVVSELNINDENYTNLKYIAFYLEIDDEDGSKIVVDRETVPFMADGINAHDNVVVELSNEIDSVGVGNDSKLDIDTPVTASTRVTLFSGATPLDIWKVEVSGFRDPQQTQYEVKTYVVDNNGNTTSTVVSTTNPSTVVELQIILKNGFEFGEDLREKLLVTVTAKQGSTDVIGYTTFVLAAIKGGKDGAVYKIQPEPDYVVFDIETGEFNPSHHSAAAYAYLNGQRMSLSMTQGADYMMKYTMGVVTDMDQATTDWNSAVYATYSEGTLIPFDSVSLTRTQNIVFYLAVNTPSGWQVVDRESVPLLINGKEGKDGIGSVIFDLTNENFVISTGPDAILDIGAGQSVTGGTYVVCRSGNTPVAITITATTQQSFDSAHGSFVVEDNGTSYPFIKITLNNGFNFGADRKIEFNVSCRAIIDSTTGETIFSIISVADGEEGKVYKVMSSAGAVLYDQNTQQYGPAEGTGHGISFQTYMNNELLSGIRYSYRIIDAEGNERGSGSPAASNKLTITSYAGVTEGWIKVTGTTAGGAWDSCDVPIIPSGKNGSGVVADLTNDADTVGLGGDMVLDLPSGTNYIDFVTTGYIMENATKIELTGSAVTPSVSGIAVTGTRSSDKKEYGFRFRMNNGFNFSSYASNGGKIDFTIKMTGTTKYEGSKEMVVKYSIQGLKDGEDGVVYKIIPSCACIKSEFDETNRTYNFTPSTISAKVYNAGAEFTSNALTMKYTVNDEDSNVRYENYTPGQALNIASLYASDGIKNSITFYAYLNGTLLIDKESVPVVFDGEDSVGGIKVGIEPPRIGVHVNEQKNPTSEFHTSARVWMESGSSIVAMSNVSVSYNVGGVSSSTAPAGVTASIVNGTGLYKSLNVTATTATNLSNPIVIEVKARPDGATAAEERIGTFILEENSGGKGDRGALTRIRDFSTNYTYQNGSDGDDYLDIVVYHDPTTFGGGYYLCLKDQATTPAVAPKVKMSGEQTVVDTTDTYWQYYPEAAFTASKVATFGTWPNGWVIDSGKIQHTQSAITLDADGEIEVSETGRTYYKYAGNGITLYTTKNYKNADMFRDNFGGNVVTYQKLGSGDNTRYVSYSSDYVLSGTSSSPQLVYTENVQNAALYGEKTSYEEGIRFRVSEPVSADITVNTNVTGYMVETKYMILSAQDQTDPYVQPTYMDEVSGISWYVTVTPITGKFEGKILAGSNATNTCTIKNVVEIGGSIYDGDTHEEYLYEAVSAALPASWGDVYDLSSIPSDIDWMSRDTWMPYKTYYYCEFDAFTISDGTNTPSTTSLEVNGTNVYVSASITSNYFTNGNKYKLSSTFPSGQSIAPQTETLAYSSTENLAGPIPNAIVSSTERGRTEEDGNIIIAAGMEKSMSIYKWVGPNSEIIYTIYPYATSSFGVSSGETIAVYDSTELPLEKNAVLVYDSSYTDVKIIFNGVEYQSNGQSEIVDPAKFANTRIYANGRIVTNNLYANDGTFNGVLNAKGGTFNGTIRATDGIMENVDVKNGMFSGDIVLRGGNSITVYGEDAQIPSVTISSKDISVVPSSYNVSAGSGSLSRTNSSWGMSSGSETIVLSSTNITNGSNVTIPQFRVSIDFKKKVSNVSVKIMYDTGGATSSLLSITRSETKDHYETLSSEQSLNVSSDCVLTIKMKVDYSLKSGFLGYSAVYVNATPTKPMAILNGGGSGINQVTIGKNGISYASPDANFYIKNDSGKTTILAQVKNTYSKYNGIQIDNDEVTLFANNKKYRLYGSQQLTTGQYVITWTESTQ